jgi:AraC family transcriptional regulator of adaptative response/methylated-DNA-[protein]-cysteine methyltransferase
MTQFSKYINDVDRWKAVVDRENSADGCFYYAVKTTGIFCRPSCSSKLPNCENVEYFLSCQEAQASGYRACKKCRPTGTSVKEETEQKIIKACRIIENSNAVPKLVDLAKKVGLSSYHFHRLFRKYVGVTPKQFASIHRSKRLSDSLKSNDSITEAFYEAGYSSSSGAYNKNQDQLSMKPKEYKSGGVAITIYYGVIECILGWIIVAATDRGICSIEFGDDPAVLPQQLQDRFPKGTIIKAGPGFTNLIEKVVNFIKTPSDNFKLPLDIQGTAFQQQVWNILRQIKPGQTMSYAEVAEKIGNPNAVRAVATACASNKLAVVIPCHRVISKDGRLSGYRWGVERKKMLLDNEKKKCEPWGVNWQPQTSQRLSRLRA